MTSLLVSVHTSIKDPTKRTVYILPLAQRSAEKPPLTRCHVLARINWLLYTVSEECPAQAAWVHSANQHQYSMHRGLAGIERFREQAQGCVGCSSLVGLTIQCTCSCRQTLVDRFSGGGLVIATLCTGGRPDDTWRGRTPTFFFLRKKDSAKSDEQIVVQTVKKIKRLFTELAENGSTGEKFACSFAWEEKKVCFWLGVKKKTFAQRKKP